MSTVRRFAVLAAVGAAVAAAGVCVLAPSTPAGVSGSPHDFSTTTGPYTNIFPGGACSACHIPHGADTSTGAYVLWSRNLQSYRTKLGMNGVDSKLWGREPNYVLQPTISCYDCHDDHSVTSFDDLPLRGTGGFSASHYPQDIAFGYTKQSLGTMLDDGPGGTVSGYYENRPPYTTTPLVYFGADPNLNPTDNAALPRTGGHYFKRHDPDNVAQASSPVNIGDKLPCRDCHDPHAYGGSRQAFIRPDLPQASGISPPSAVTASTFMANPSGTRNDAESRKICASCHAYSDVGTPVRYSEINPAYLFSAGYIPKPPDSVEGTAVTIWEHRSGNGTACVSCHRHNAIEATCDQCHFFPGKPGGVQETSAHKRHVNVASDTPVGRGYGCGICHAVYSHNQSGVTGTSDWGSRFSRAYVNVSFDNAWNPSGAYDNSLRRCSGLYCHGDSVTPSNWGGTATRPTWDNASTAPCGSCHAAGSQLRTSNHPVHMDNASHVYGPNTLDNATCGSGGGCHTGYGLSPTSTHVDRVKSFRLSPPSDNTASSFGTPTQACAKCHSTASAPFDNNAGPGVGDNLARANWGDNTYRLPCLSCHNATLPGNTRADGTGRPAPNIQGYWAFSGHGATAIDNASTTTTDPGAGVDQVPPVACGYCHGATTTAHFGPGKDSGNPWRLLPATNYATAGGLDQFCQSKCHFTGVPADHTWNVAAGEPKGGSDTHPTSTPVVPNASTYHVPPPELPLRGVLTDNNAAPDGSQDILCISCHDPHGVGSPAASPRAFAGVNTGTVTDIVNNTVHMLRYDFGLGTGDVICRKCHN